jgi:CubicO group peptidase (beta-lactamase class C family)
VKTEIGATFDLASWTRMTLRRCGRAGQRLWSGVGLSGSLSARRRRLGQRAADQPRYKWAGGGFLMTPSDLARFGAALIDSPTSRITAAERALLFTR